MLSFFFNFSCSLRDDLQLQAQELSSSQSQLWSHRITFTESQAQLVPIQFERDRLLREKEFLEKEVLNATSALSVKTEELLSEKRGFSTKILDLESKISDLEYQVLSTTDQLSNAKVTVYLKNFESKF